MDLCWENIIVILSMSMILIPDYLFRSSVKSLCFNHTCVNKTMYIILYNHCFINGVYDRKKLFSFFKVKRKFEEQFYLDGKVDSKEILTTG